MSKIYKVEIITRKEKFQELKDELTRIGVEGMTVYDVQGCGVQKGIVTYYRGVKTEIQLIPKIKIDIVVSEVPYEKVLETAQRVLKTGTVFERDRVYDEVAVQVVRVQVDGHDTFKIIAEEYGVTIYAISDINRGHTFVNDTLDYPLRKRSKRSILNTQKVMEIINLLKNTTLNFAQIAEQVQCNEFTIGSINRGQNS